MYSSQNILPGGEAGTPQTGNGEITLLALELVYVFSRQKDWRVAQKWGVEKAMTKNGDHTLPSLQLP